MIHWPVTKPNVYNMAAADYLADLACETPSLNAGTVDLLIDECPRVAWHHHPRLNPNYKPDTARHFDVGKAGHLLLLEPEKFASETMLIDAEDYKESWAQARRREARQTNRTPLLVREWDMLTAMRAAIRENDEIEQALRTGKAERSVFAKDDRFGIWRRCRPDLLAHHGGWLMDLKIVVSANPTQFGRLAKTWNWYRRAPWYLDTFEMATGVRPARYFFALISKTEPFLATLNELNFEDLNLGRMDCDHACRVWAECLAAGADRQFWPSYRSPNTPDRDTAFRTGMPGYAHQEIGLRHEAWAAAELRRLHDLANKPIA